MSRVLYEASYIGSPKGFFIIAIVVIGLILGLISLIYEIKREYRMNKTEESFTHKVNYIFASICAVFWVIFTLIMFTGTILGYSRVILRYKRGNYREVEGIVEDYSGSKVYTFKVNGVEFEISGHNATWGYSYWQGENVITGDGQQLKIRYIPPDTIVYIEEIGPPLMWQDHTEEMLWSGGSGVHELTETKAYVREDKRAEEYKQLFQESETTDFTRIGMIRYSESDGFQEYIEQD